jgi:hypothetical protein
MGNKTANNMLSQLNINEEDKFHPAHFINFTKQNLLMLLMFRVNLTTALPAQLPPFLEFEETA